MKTNNPTGCQSARRAPLVVTVLAGIITTSIWIGTPAVHAQDDNRNGDASKVRIGLEITPVPLALHGRDTALIGIGSYIVNALAGCNDCHSAGTPTQFVPGGNPFFGQRPPKTNPAVYLGGGRDFGSLTPGSPHIISRNLTPDKSGRPIGGDTFAEFLHTMRTGTDPDHVHPTCSATSQGPCLPPPFDGELLQIMPWPVFRNLSTRDLLAVYEYLSAIPCVESGPGQPSHACK